MRMPAHSRSEADTELAEVFDELLAGFEADGVHSSFPGSADKTFHVIDKNRLLRPEADLFEDAPVDLEVRLSGPYFMRWKFLIEMAEKLKILFNIGEMHGVGI